MSHHDYVISQRLCTDAYSFYGIIMAAMRRAGTENLDKLCQAFPDTWTELHARYHAPGGFIPGDPEYPLSGAFFTIARPETPTPDTEH